MTLRKLLPLAGVAAVALGVATVASGSDGESTTGYEFRMHLPNALGLRDGSLVTVGGVEVGTVDVGFDDRDRVVVTAKLEDGQAPIGRDARAFITSVNLLGQKRLEVNRGSGAPLPSGSELPASRVTATTDLDQVLQVLTPDVRSRLSILVNELAATVGGRDQDLSQLIRTLPPTISKATQVVDEITGDTDTLARLLVRSDRVVAPLAAERKALSRLVDSASGAAGSVADKRAQLQATLERAPGTLRTLRGFLGALEQATVPLGPAARDLKATAPELLRTMDALTPVRKAIAPALDEATAAAPALTALAGGATPVLRRAVPTLASLAALATDLAPVTGTLDKSVDNLIATVDNWSRAVQYRDGLSHIFRGEAGMTPQTFEGVLGRYLKLIGADRKRKAGAKKQPGGAKKPAAAVERPKPKLPQATPKLPLPDRLTAPVDGVLGTVKDVVGGLTGKQPAGTGGTTDGTGSLLDFLLKP